LSCAEMVHENPPGRKTALLSRCRPLSVSGSAAGEPCRPLECRPTVTIQRATLRSPTRTASRSALPRRRAPVQMPRRACPTSEGA
jgi:hypothetical protein